MRRPKLVLFRWAIAVLAVAFLAAELPRFSFQALGGVLVFTMFAALSELMAIRLPQGGMASISMAILLPALILFPMPVPLLIASAGVLAAVAIRQQPAGTTEVLFRVAQRIVVIFGTATIFQLAGGVVGNIEIYRDFWPMWAATLTYVFLEIGFEQLSVILEKDIPLVPALAGSGKVLGPLYVAVASLGVLTALMYTSMGYWSVALFFLPLLLTRHSFKLFFEIRKTYQDAITALGKAIEGARSARLGHGERVADCAVEIGKELGLYWDDLENLSYAALLHDIGGLAGDDDSLVHEGRRESAEEDSAHTGADILEQVEFLTRAAPFVRYHRQPLKAGKRVAEDPENPLGARIIGVANSYDEMTEAVASEDRITAGQAINRVKKQSGYVFDPIVVRALIKVLGNQEKIEVKSR